MSKVAVVAHADKDPDPGWDESFKSRAAPKNVRRAVAEGADLVFAWRGEGMVLDAP